MNLAIVGATGLVGRKFLEVINEYNIDVDNLYLFASRRSAGVTIEFQGSKYKVIELNEKNIANVKVDYVLFSAGEKVSKEYAKCFNRIGAVVIDNSSAFRMEDNVPLIVPEVNDIDEYFESKVIANPNCSTIQCMLPLKVLNDAFNLQAVDYTTFQAVSGSGMSGILDLEKCSQGQNAQFYPYSIFNNCIAHIGNFDSNGNSKEEIKMINESRKILNLPNLKATATCVRVPITYAHSVSICATFEKDVDIEKARSLLSKFKGITLCDDVKNNIYPMPIDAVGQDNVLVGRLRLDQNNCKRLLLFCVADNLRKGAASNAVQIMQNIENKKMSGKNI